MFGDVHTEEELDFLCENRGQSPVRGDDDDDDNASQSSSATVIGRPTHRGLSAVRGDDDDNDNASQSSSATVIGRPTRRGLSAVRGDDDDDDNASQSSSASVIGSPTRRGLSLVRYDDDNASQTSSASVIRRPTRRGLSPVRGDGDDDDNASQSSSASVIGRPTRRGLSPVRYDDDDASQSSSDDRARVQRNSSIFDTQLILMFEVTDLVGIVSLLYGMLLLSDALSRRDMAPLDCMLNHTALLDLSMLLRALGEEGMSLEFQHMASYLILYSSLHLSEDLLHEVILCMGYFTCSIPIIRSPTLLFSFYMSMDICVPIRVVWVVLHQLCSLPFQYFSNPRLFPALISCCYNNHSNRRILEQEVSCVLLANFIEMDARAADNRMSLTCRFPQEQWLAVEQYFRVTL
ncbi:hypothetical protein ACOMHN_047064 [Nucella lapillus]